MVRILSLLALIPLSLALYTPHERIHHASTSASAPLISSISAEVVPDSYIVVLKPTAPADVHMRWLGRTLADGNKLLRSGKDGKGVETDIKHVYDLGFAKGYAGRFDEETLELIRSSPHVSFIERDQIMYASDRQKQSDAPWGLVRVSHRKLPSTESGAKNHSYLYSEEAGEGVTVYVVDTGVQIHHHDFEGRAFWGKTIPVNDTDTDGNGHGTHVAGTIAGKTYGVAKKAKIVAVKVLSSNGSGTMADVVKGIEEVVNMHKEAEAAAGDEIGDDGKKRKRKVRSVANMSLGGGRSRVLDRVVDAAVEAGVSFAVAAGNSGDDACDYSPAASGKAVTVGATTSIDAMAWFSNHGDCVDLFAPGHQIESTWIGTNTSTNTISGTSMASPHVAGVLALLLSQPEYADLTPKELKERLLELSSEGLVSGIPKWAGGGKNLLLYSDPPKGEHKGRKGGKEGKFRGRKGVKAWKKVWEEMLEEIVEEVMDA